MCLMSSNYAVAKVSYGFRGALWDARSSALTRRIKSSVASCWLSRRFASALIFWFKSSNAAATRDSRGKAMSISFATIGDLRQHRSAFYCTVPVLGLPSLSGPCAIHACSCTRSSRSTASLNIVPVGLTDFVGTGAYHRGNIRSRQNYDCALWNTKKNTATLKQATA
jgi:hypothetical protein